MTEATRRPRSVDLNGVPAVDAIVAATAKLLERQSFSDISVANILTEATVSRATFYFYFASKFSVLSAMLQEAMDDIFERVQPFLSRAATDPPAIALERSIGAVASSWHRHRAVLQAANQHWQAEPALREFWLGVVERFVAAGAAEIDRERRAGLITSSLPSRTLAATLFWGTERVLHVAGMGVDPELIDEETAVGPLVAMWKGTLYGS